MKKNKYNRTDFSSQQELKALLKAEIHHIALL